MKEKIEIEKKMLSALLRGAMVARGCALMYAPALAESSRAGQSIAVVDRLGELIEAAAKILNENKEEPKDDQA